MDPNYWNFNLEASIYLQKITIYPNTNLSLVKVLCSKSFKHSDYDVGPFMVIITSHSTSVLSYMFHMLNDQCNTTQILGTWLCCLLHLLTPDMQLGMPHCSANSIYIKSTWEDCIPVLYSLPVLSITTKHHELLDITRSVYLNAYVLECQLSCPLME